MSADAGHRYTFGAPKGGGWPTFGPDGKIVRERTLLPVSEDVIQRCTGDGEEHCVCHP